MWNPGDIIAWRGIFNNRIWSAVPSFVVKDSPEEIVIATLPGTDCQLEETYAQGKKKANRIWQFNDKDWRLANFTWRTNRVLTLIEAKKFYAIMLFWDHASDEFNGYYVNFQLPFKRNHCGIDTLDLDLDLDIEPDLSFRWKDEDDYAQALRHGVITPEWVQSIEDARPEALARLEKRQYPFDGSWLNWKPDPHWLPPKLPVDWDKI